MTTDDEAYERFVEGYFSAGRRSVPEDWPEDLRERCRLFLKLAQSSDSVAAQGGSAGLMHTLSVRGVESSVTLRGPDQQPPEDLTQGPDRYVVEEEIARGGMGKILLAYDRDFRRRIAMKVMLSRPHLAAQSSRFLEEAQATAQLEHPNIGPVYDIGLNADGNIFFTMKWIRGRNLGEILAAGEVEFTQIRLVQLLQQVAMGVDFAHHRGVIHRDLKPDNIMVGDYGEVLVMDWGLAKILGHTSAAGQVSAADLDEKARDQVVTSRAEKGVQTLRGAVQGSAAYMAPEQAQGDIDAIDARTDVFGLGTVLYAILTGELVVYEGVTLQEVLGKARRGEVVVPSQRTPERYIPPALEEICMKALAPRPADRFQSARDLHDRLQAYVEGIHDEERRAAEAARLLGEADALRGEWERLMRAERELRQQEARLRGEIPAHGDAQAKESLWRAVEELKRAGEATSRLFNETTAAYHSVLRTQTTNESARKQLAEMYFDRMTFAEARGDREAASLYQGLVVQQHDPEYAELLGSEELVELRSDPPGAEVFLSRYEEHGVVLIATEPELLGETPLCRGLPRGSYLIRLRKPGFTEVLYPAFLERGCGVDETIRLYVEGTIPDGYLQIAGGHSVVGGMSSSAVLPRSRLRLKEFFAARFPVTLNEYCEFLTDYFPHAPLDDDQRYRMTPKFDRQALVVQGADGVYRPNAELRGKTSETGLRGDWPVVAVSWTGATEYCRWRSGQTGVALRLLEESEWERCARGADGRLYPWGNEFDWALCKGALSRAGQSSLEPIGSISSDVSPFGLRDMAGGVREFCQKARGAGYPLMKGGSWFHYLPAVFSSESRMALQSDDMKSSDIGFRVGFETLPQREQSCQGF